jgi:hypothetical protein
VAVEGYNPMRRASTMATLAAVMTEPVPPPRRAGALGATLRAVLVPDPAARPNGDQLDRMLATAEHGTPVPVGPPTPAGPAFAAPPAYPPSSSGQSGPWYQPEPSSIPYRKPAAERRRVAAMVLSYSVSAVVVVVAVVFLLNSMKDTGGTPSNTGAGSGTALGATVTDVGGGPEDPTTTTTAAAKENLLTPEGARKAVGALAKVMGGNKVSNLTLYPDFATATAPAKSVKNGFDDFTYRNGVATRDGPDTVDADRAVLDLDAVNWDALPALWQRAEKELGVAKPTMRYIVVDTDIIDGTAEFKLYLSDDYGAAYLLANLDGEVLELFPRDG